MTSFIVKTAEQSQTRYDVKRQQTMAGHHVRKIYMKKNNILRSCLETFPFKIEKR
jgi:hypothetical protein